MNILDLMIVGSWRFRGGDYGIRMYWGLVIWIILVKNVKVKGRYIFFKVFRRKRIRIFYFCKKGEIFI